MAASAKKAKAKRRHLEENINVGEEKKEQWRRRRHLYSAWHCVHQQRGLVTTQSAAAAAKTTTCLKIINQLNDSISRRRQT